MYPDSFPEINLGIGEYVRDRATAALKTLSGVWAVGKTVDLKISNHIKHES